MKLCAGRFFQAGSPLGLNLPAICSVFTTSSMVVIAVEAGGALRHSLSLS